MSMRFFLVLMGLFTLCTYRVLGQSSYFDYQMNDRINIYYDGFDDNRNGWVARLENLKLERKIENGCMVLENWDTENGKFSYITQKIDVSRDFQLETRYQFVKGAESYGMEFQWGRDTEGNYYSVHLSGNSQYWIGKYEKEIGYVAFVPWTKSTLVNGRSWNKITVRKVKDKYSVFLNESFIYSFNFQAFFGDRVSFCVPKSTTMRVDYLMIDYLQKQSVSQNLEDESLKTNIPIQPSAYEPTGKRVALIIGNKNYTHVSPLQNTLNDAQDMANLLRNKGFEIISVFDAKTKRDIREAVLRFNNSLKGQKDAVGLLYYSGHGMQVDGTNYLIPTNADLQIKADIEDQCFNVDYMLKTMEEVGSSLNIVILDACRNNPFKSFDRSTDRGLRMVDAPKGSYIVYATKPGSVASDGSGRNGLFTSKLLKYMAQPSMSIEQVFKNVAREVALESSDEQRPWISSDFTGEFFFSK